VADYTIIPVLEHMDVNRPHVFSFSEEAPSQDSVLTETSISERFHVPTPLINPLDIPYDWHDVDNRFRIEVRNRRATDVMDCDNLPFKQALEFGRLFHEFCLPYRIIWDDLYFSHGSIPSFN
jgi:hypothetical protein